MNSTGNKIKEFLFPGKIRGFRGDFEKENGRALCFLLITGAAISLISFLL